MGRYILITSHIKLGYFIKRMTMGNKEEARRVLEDMRCRMNEKITSGCSELILKIKESLNVIINSAISNAEKLEESLVLDIAKAEESLEAIKNISKDVIGPVTQMEIMIDPNIFSEESDVSMINPATSKESKVDLIDLDQDEPEERIPEMFFKPSNVKERRKTLHCEYPLCDVKYKTQFDLDAHQLLEHKMELKDMHKKGTTFSATKQNSLKRKLNLENDDLKEACLSDMLDGSGQNFKPI